MADIGVEDTVVDTVFSIETEGEVEIELLDSRAGVVVASIVSICVVDGVTDSLVVSIFCSSAGVTETDVGLVENLVFSAERAQDGVTGLMVSSTSSRAPKFLIPTAKAVSAGDTLCG